jgi:hypothetical protein
MGTQVYAHDKVKLTLLQVVGCLGLISSVLNHTEVARNQKLVEHSYLHWQRPLPFSIMPHDKLGQIHCAIKILQSFSPAFVAGCYNDMN